MDFLEQLQSSFDVRPVGIVTFAESPEFCGRILYPRQRLLLKLFFLEELTPAEEKVLDYWIAGGRNGDEIVISPFIRERIAWLKSHGYKHFQNIVWVGGRRSSKGHITGIAMAYQMYHLLRLDDPVAHYGLAADKQIYFPAIAVAQDQAKRLQYADFASTVGSCAAMKKYVQKIQELEFSVNTQSDMRQQSVDDRQGGKKVTRDESTLRGVALPANSNSIRGMTVYCADMDEFAFFEHGESSKSDSECQAALKPSLDQFGRDAMMFYKSSPASKTGTFYELAQRGMAVKDGEAADHATLTIQMPSWSLYEGWWEDPEYTGNQFCIQVRPDWDPEQRNEDGSYYYTETDREAIIIQRNEESADPEKYKVERRGQWSETIDAYLLPEKVDAMFAGKPLTDGTGYEPMKINRMESSYNYQYVAHLDPSSTTAGFGFALGHLEYLEILGQVTPNAMFDIVKIWRPRDFSGGVIIWEDVIQEILFYCQQFRPYELSSDQFSAGPLLQTLRNELRKRNLTDVRVFEKTATAATNWKRYETFKTALYRGLVHAPMYSLDGSISIDCKQASDELKFLQVINTGQIPRVEKQSTGEIQTKDAADALAAVTESLIGGLDITAARNDMIMQPIRVGAQGGYQMMLSEGQHPLGNLTLSDARRNFELSQISRQQSGRGPGSSLGPVRAWGARPKSRRFGR